MFIVIKQGVYIRDLFGPFETEQDAIRFAIRAARNEADSYHSFGVYPFASTELREPGVFWEAVETPTVVLRDNKRKGRLQKWENNAWHPMECPNFEARSMDQLADAVFVDDCANCGQRYAVHQ